MTSNSNVGEGIGRKTLWERVASPKGIGIALALFIVGLWGFYAEENARGKRDWEDYKKELEAKGVEFDWSKFVPPTVPDEQNFAMTPFLAPLFDFNPRPLGPEQSPWRDVDGWARTTNFAVEFSPTNNLWKNEPADQAGKLTDLTYAMHLMQKRKNADAEMPVFKNRADAATAVLAALKQFDPVLNELRTASHRPYARFNVNYMQEDPIEILLPHLGLNRRLTQVLLVRASAELALGKTEDAAEDVHFMIFLCETIRKEPFLISHSVRMSLLRSVEQVIWEGLAEHRWSEPQLADLESTMRNVTPIKDIYLPVTGEQTAFGVRFFDYARAHPNHLRRMLDNMGANFWGGALNAAPSGWLYQEEISCQKLYMEQIASCIDFQKALAQPRRADQIWQTTTNSDGGTASALWHHTLFTGLLVPNLFQLILNTTLSQASADETVLACALERYRCANGHYPEALAELTPKYLVATPLDVCTGEPYIYKRTDNDHFLLYSVGWNQKDDGGTLAVDKWEHTVKRREGDWPWPQYAGEKGS